MAELPDAHIHHFFSDPATGRVQLDEDQEPMIGFYYEIERPNGAPTHLMGPYTTAEDAEQACQRAFERGDY